MHVSRWVAPREIVSCYRQLAPAGSYPPANPPLSLDVMADFFALAVYSPTDHTIGSFATRGVECKIPPDGKWIAYVAGGIVVQPFPAGSAKIQVSNSGAEPHWSHDGRQIFFIQPDRKLIAVSFDPQGQRALRVSSFRLVSWPNGSRIGSILSRPTAVSSSTPFSRIQLYP